MYSEGIDLNVVVYIVEEEHIYINCEVLIFDSFF